MDRKSFSSSKKDMYLGEQRWWKEQKCNLMQRAFSWEKGPVASTTQTHGGSEEPLRLLTWKWSKQQIVLTNNEKYL